MSLSYFEQENTAERDREAEEVLFYESVLSMMKAWRDRAEKGKVFIRGDEIPWQTNRQGRMGYYVHERLKDTALTDWRIFIHDVQEHSGAHVHQGGLGLYIIEGTGATVINGVRHAWGPGDLVILPVVPGGCEHQHFSDEGSTSQFLAFIYLPFWYATGAIFEQRQDSPKWTGS